MNDLTSEMRERFGESETEEYIMLSKAMRSLLTVGEMYYASPPLSAQEKMAGDHFESMIVKMMDQPTKTQTMIEALVALILHMKAGGEYAEWFESMGISAEVEGE